MSTRTRRRLLLGLATLSVVGLLSMHGLDPVVTATAETHLAHSTGEGGPNHHGAAGLCVFVAAVGTLALAASRGSGGSGERLAGVFGARSVSCGAVPPTSSGPPLLHRLCVLRL